MDAKIAGVIWAKFGGYHLTSKVAISLKMRPHLQRSSLQVGGRDRWLLLIINVSLISHKLLGKSAAMPIYGIIWRFWNVMHAVALSLHNQALVIAHLMKCQHISLRSA